MLKPEKTTAEKLGEIFGLLVAAALGSALNGWLLSICASFLFLSFFLTFPQWWLLALTFRSLIGSSDK
jgi:uncharacterized membrane protein YkgB